MVVLTRKHATNDISRLEKAEKSIAPMARSPGGMETENCDLRLQNQFLEVFQ